MVVRNLGDKIGLKWRTIYADIVAVGPNSLQAFLINLARRPDRLRKMTQQLDALEISFQRVDAIDAQTTADADLEKKFRTDGPLGVIPKGDKCCALSHARAWRALADSEESHGLILEDDVALDASGASLLRGSDWIPPDVDLVKIERYGPPNQRVLIDERIAVGNGRKIGRLRSRHTGAAAYILSRRTAQALLASTQTWTLPVDHLLFNPNNSPMANVLRPHQMIPAVAHQSQQLGGGTDIGEWRAILRRFSVRYAKREIVRAYFELRILPSQIARWLRQESTLVRVDEPAPIRSRASL
jgi:glycosyl transferase family 25